MSEILNNLLSDDFMPHGQCFLWLPEILWLHVISDALITAAYYSIPASIILFLHRRPDVHFPHIGALFAAFIFLCGTTHLVAIYVLWNGNYGAQGLVKAATAIVSICTAVVIWRLLPEALKIISKAQLEQKIDMATSELSAKNRQLGQVNADLESFATVASHDMKEPLRTLVVFSQLLEKDLGDNLPEAAERDLGHIVGAAKRMQNLVQDLLDLSHASRSAVRLENVAVDDCVDEALQALSVKLEETSAQIERPPLPVVLADRTLLVQLYQNLISNALKFATPGRSPEIKLTVDAAHGSIVLGVADNGIGIDPEMREEIFEPFRRLHGRSEYEGTGIGLAICRKAAERLGGRIWVDSSNDTGTHFRFTVSSGLEARVDAAPRALAPATAGHPPG